MKSLKSVIDADMQSVLLCDENYPVPLSFVKSKVWKGHRDLVISVHFSPSNSNLFVSVLDNGYVKLWKTDVLEEVWETKAHEKWVECVRFNPDGTKIASGSGDGFIIIYDAHSGKVLNKFDCTTIVNCLDFLSDGNHVVCGLINSTLQIWNMKMEKRVKVLMGHNNSVYSCTASPDGAIIVSGDGSGVIRIWDRATGKCKQIWKEHEGNVNCLIYSKSGKKVLSISYDKTAILWTTEEGKVVQRFEGHENWVVSGALSSDETLVYTASEDKTVKIWDTQTSACLQTICFDQNIHSLSLSPDESKIIAGLDYGYLSLLQRLPGLVTRSVSIPYVARSSVLSIDQSTIVVTTEKEETLIIDTITGNILHRAVTNGTDICLDMDGQTLVSKNVALHQYQQRCLMAGFLLLHGAGSKFSNRSKLSIWDVEEVFCDGVTYPDLDVDSRQIYEKIMGYQ
jgi:WD40 repeat protein